MRDNIKRNGSMYYFLWLFILCSILLTISEFLGGVFIDKVFDLTLWDYSDHLFNFGKYISLEMMMVWGISSVVFIILLKKVSDKIVKKYQEYYLGY